MATRHWKNDDLVIEIDMPQAERYDFPPAGNHPDKEKFLRSAWSIRKMPAGAGNKTGMMRLPEIPGQYVVLDVKGAKGHLMDPLGWKENEALMEQIRNVCKSSTGIAIPDVRPIRDLSFDLAPERVNSWLYHMRQAVKESELVVEDGDVVEVQKRRSARAVQGVLLTASDAEIADVIPDWFDTVIDRCTDRTMPRTIREMEIWRKGDWSRHKLGAGAYHEVTQ